MKKLIFLLALSYAIVGCFTTTKIEKVIPGTTTMAFLDFQPYIEKGFIFAPGDINQNYVPIGMVYYTVLPDMVKIYESTSDVITDKMIESGVAIIENDKSYTYKLTVPRQTKNVNDVLKTAYENAISLEANGVIHLKYHFNAEKEIILTGTVVKIEQ